MEALAALLDLIRKQGVAKGNLLGFFHVLIGRSITASGGGVISSGLPWRELANWLKKPRWDIQMVADLGLDPDDRPPKDRQRFWYAAIARAGVDSATAAQAGDAFAKKLERHGYQVGPGPATR